MVSKTQQKDVAKDKAAEVVSALTDAAETGREKVGPAVQTATDRLTEAADAAAVAAEPHVTKAKRSARKAAKKAAKRAAEAADAAEPQVTKAKRSARKAAKKAAKRAAKAADTAAETVDPQVSEAGRSARKAAKKAAKQAAKRARKAGEQAYAALPEQAQTAVVTVAPDVVKKRRSKGTVLIALGVLAGAGAVALLVSGRKKPATDAAATPLPEVEQIDAAAAEEAVLSESDDAVGDAEQQVDEAVSGRRGRHAAKE